MESKHSYILTIEAHCTCCDWNSISSSKCLAEAITHSKQSTHPVSLSTEFRMWDTNWPDPGKTVKNTTIFKDS